ncbi:ATP12 family chaperone protein [Rhodospirillum sp. A1_3_36]|uniref:ATP12 family chaperone protein n=1 Tax=Rhodospirillum sp. A1_3_36 TaxID=3391666 RepID=UPI0039A59237
MSLKKVTPSIAVPTKAVDKPLSAQTRRRFYKAVGLLVEGEGFGLTLDGRAVRTPGRRSLTLPNRRLAEAIAAEWDAQGETIEPATMPLTQLANTALDRVTEAREALTDELIRYAGSDLLCYRVSSPESLVTRQKSGWDPVLEWLKTRHGVVLTVTQGLMPVDQPKESLIAVRRVLEEMDPWVFAVVQSVTAICGSLILALALADGLMGPAETLALATMDEGHQMELWGEDREALERLAHIGAELEQANRFLSLVS